MSDAPFGLNDKEREVLRLLARGHDAKSAAATLGLSVHTINERLREARLKTRSSSSRGAARLLAQIEDPKELGPTELGVRSGNPAPETESALHPGATPGSRFWGRWGIPVMISALTVAATLVAVHAISQQSAENTAPVVVSTFPKSNVVVEPGPVDLSVTFDRPMRAQSFSFVQKSADTYPECGSNLPVQSTDRRTFTLRCDARPGRRYEVWFNSPPYLNFMGENGVAAVPYRLRFQTRR